MSERLLSWASIQWKNFQVIQLSYQCYVSANMYTCYTYIHTHTHTYIHIRINRYTIIMYYVRSENLDCRPADRQVFVLYVWEGQERTVHDTLDGVNMNASNLLYVYASPVYIGMTMTVNRSIPFWNCLCSRQTADKSWHGSVSHLKCTLRVRRYEAHIQVQIEEMDEFWWVMPTYSTESTHFFNLGQTKF